MSRGLLDGIFPLASSGLLLSCCDKTLIRSIWGGKDLFGLQAFTEGSQGENLEARTEHGGTLLPGVLSLVCLATFCMQPRPTCPDIALPTVGVALPPPINNKENTPQECLQGNLMKTILQLKPPLSRCVKLATRSANLGISLCRSRLIRGLSLLPQDSCILVARNTSTWRPTAPSLYQKESQERWSCS